MMKQVAFFVAAFTSIFLTNSSFASPYCLQGRLEAGAGLLYWTVSNVDLKLGQFVQTHASTKRQECELLPHYSLGFAIEGNYYGCDGCDFASLSWIHLCTSAKRTIHDPNFQFFFNDTSILASTAQGRLKLGYDKVNLRLGKKVVHWKSMQLYVYVGGRFLYFESTLLAKGRQDSGQAYSQVQQSQFNGAGIELGIGAILDLTCHLSLFAQASPTIAFGLKKVSMNSFSIDPNATLSSSLDIRDPFRCVCVPGLDLKIGLRGQKDFALLRRQTLCFQLIGEIGFELNGYRNGWSRRQPTSSVNALLDETLTFFGPYASLKIGF